jgi:hypothetical protein
MATNDARGRLEQNNNLGRKLEGAESAARLANVSLFDLASNIH